MTKNRKDLITYAVITISIIAIVASFAVFMLKIENDTEEDCLGTIASTTHQLANMFNNTMNQKESQLMAFAELFGSGEEDFYVLASTFCSTQKFDSVCLHWRDGDRESLSYGIHPHGSVQYSSFEEEAAKLPYLSDMVYERKDGEETYEYKRSEQYVYAAVPVFSDGYASSDMPDAILYGYIALSSFSDFVSSTAYDGKCDYYIVDGTTGQFLLDDCHRFDENESEIPLRSIEMIEKKVPKSGYSYHRMKADLLAGDEPGYFVFFSEDSSVYMYTYYMPLGINNWSILLMIDEPTAFETFYEIREALVTLMIIVAVLISIVFCATMIGATMRRHEDKEALHMSEYINSVQAALISAHNNPDFVNQALKVIAKESNAETVLLLIFNDKLIDNAYYWPSRDRTAAMALIGLNISEVFPVMYDALVSNESMLVDESNMSDQISETAQEVLKELSVTNMLIVPIMDNAGMLKAAIATVNVSEKRGSPEMLRCLTRDFFLAIANLESYTIIKNMGAIDYLTGAKNRNSFESELGELAVSDCKNLWCMYVDVNGLHEMNNTHGHSAGDLMLTTVAKVMKGVLGDKNVYRIGGDEFVSFVKDSSHTNFMSYKHRIMDELSKHGYSVSVGFAFVEKNENNVFDVDKAVVEAEEYMYKKKEEYYEKNGISHERENTLRSNESTVKK